MGLRTDIHSNTIFDLNEAYCPFRKKPINELIKAHCNHLQPRPYIAALVQNKDQTPFLVDGISLLQSNMTFEKVQYLVKRNFQEDFLHLEETGTKPGILKNVVLATSTEKSTAVQNARKTLLVTLNLNHEGFCEWAKLIVHDDPEDIDIAHLMKGLRKSIEDQTRLNQGASLPIGTTGVVTYVDLDLRAILTRAQSIVSASVVSPQSSLSFTHLANGQIALASGEIEEAKKHFKIAVELDDRCTLAHALLGEVLRVVDGDLERAQFHFLRALNQGYDKQFVRERLAIVLKTRIELLVRQLSGQIADK